MLKWQASFETLSRVQEKLSDTSAICWNWFFPVNFQENLPTTSIKSSWAYICQNDFVQAIGKFLDLVIDRMQVHKPIQIPID